MFLINNLLMRSAPAEVGGGQDQQNPRTLAGPVHANSHASMLSDPRSTGTSAVTLQALREQGLLGTLISALTSPTPHGADGESERDVDLEEKIIRFASRHIWMFAASFLPYFRVR